ncbi:hypothetical protein RclHR1_14690003 [Rhizophagus clarus]|uniref:F-box domain-containing protein n=1 Tax=Rhizophagus clarus TaxID=94130 RepID=A0A2Z6R5Z1_9GLOM|nr:hypothetical protein RclHR1_14690003 [Rhizophagus clarus]GES99309.1 hypothetical protein GLOIN_2v1786648 [Rhizophagus clarus]
MYKLNKDIFYLIFENLENNLYSCLLVNKTWCEIVVPMVWRNPWKEPFYLRNKQEKLLKVIISHIPDKTKIKEIYSFLKDNQIHSLDINTYKRPLFDYISFCKHLNLGSIMRIIDVNIASGRLIVRAEILKLFVNKNLRITHLYIPKHFNYQIHLIPGAKSCFSKIEFLRCYTNINNNILTGLLEICKSIKELKLYIEKYKYNNNYEITKLIEAQKKLVKIHFKLIYNFCLPHDESFCKVLENSLIKHSNTIQYFIMHKPFTTEILSSLVNLKGLDLGSNYLLQESEWSNLENLSLTSLQFLKLYRFPFKYSLSLIENTRGSLVEIELYDYFYYSENEYKKIIQVIYQNCPNLKYLTFSPRDTDTLEIENLLITCQFLNGLHIINQSNIGWDSLFKILIKVSPIRLYKFYFENNGPIKLLESLKFFIDNWKGRRPILLRLAYTMYTKKDAETENLLEKYKLEGMIEDLEEW